MIDPAIPAAVLADRLARIQDRIAAAAERAGRSPAGIQILAASKGVPPEVVAVAASAGITLFGENYVQEARAKIPAVTGIIGPCEWHLIGPLQSNKAKYCPGLFHVVQSIDNLRQAQELGRAASKQGNTKLRVLIEVNLSTDPDRAGVRPSEARDLCAAVAEIPALSVEGLMGMAPYTPDPEAARPHFRRLRQLWEQLPAEQRRTLSMGMSGDFEVAVEEGATLIRIGTALFGPRQVARG